MSDVVHPKERILNAQKRFRGSAKTHKENALESHFPSVNEPALVHPWTHAIVKLRDNGMIDIFADGDQGIRIDPKSKTINLLTDTEKHHVKAIKAFVQRDADWHISRNWTIEATNVNINTKSNVNINANGDVIVQAKNTITLKSGKELTIDSPHVTIKTDRIDVI